MADPQLPDVLLEGLRKRQEDTYNEAIKLNDYIRTLQREISDLKRVNGDREHEMVDLKCKTSALEDDNALLRRRLEQREIDVKDLKALLAEYVLDAKRQTKVKCRAESPAEEKVFPKQRCSLSPELGGPVGVIEISSDSEEDISSAQFGGTPCPDESAEDPNSQTLSPRSSEQGHHTEPSTGTTFAGITSPAVFLQAGHSSRERRQSSTFPANLKHLADHVNGKPGPPIVGSKSKRVSFADEIEDDADDEENESSANEETRPRRTIKRKKAYDFRARVTSQSASIPKPRYKYRRPPQVTGFLHEHPCSLCSKRSIPCQKKVGGGACFGCSVGRGKCEHSRRVLA